MSALLFRPNVHGIKCCTTFNVMPINNTITVANFKPHINIKLSKSFKLFIKFKVIA